MSVKVSYRTNLDILYCFVSGERDSESIKKYWQEIVDKCRNNGLRKIQVTLALSGSFEKFQAIRIYNLLYKSVDTNGLAFAVLDINDQTQANTQMACWMAKGKGVRIEYFESDSDAADWLTNKALLTA